VRLYRGEDGSWRIEPEDQDPDPAAQWGEAYRDALPRYLTALDPAFDRARDRNEFQFLLTLFRVRGMQDVGIDPWETTLRALPNILQLGKREQGTEAGLHLSLWVYGHIVEASEPYEMVMNLLDVSQGGQFRLDRFPPNNRGVPQTPGQKIHQIESVATTAGMPQVAAPMKEVWDREFRNAIFHADYGIGQDGVFFRRDRFPQRLTFLEVTARINRALAYIEAVHALYRAQIRSYEEPVVIETDPRFSQGVAEPAVVIVRKGHGAVGMQAVSTREQIAAGKIHWRMGRFRYNELPLLDADPGLSILPQDPEGLASPPPPIPT
jgi:hypothetical protein